jgi:hypothetical protein
MKNILEMLGSTDEKGLKDLQARARRGQMTFAATQYAMKTGCNCDACAFLRKAVDDELDEARREAGIDAHGNDPVERAPATVSRAQPAGDESSPDVPDRAPP